MKETYKIKRPDHIVFGDPLYFEQFKGARLKKLVTDYHVLTKFDTARLVLEEKPFSNCPDMMNRTMTLYFAPEKHMDVYLSEQMYEGQKEKTKVVLVDTARYLLKVDDRSDEIHTGADGEWASSQRFTIKTGNIAFRMPLSSRLRFPTIKTSQRCVRWPGTFFRIWSRLCRKSIA